MPILLRNFVRTPSKALCGLHTRRESQTLYRHCLQQKSRDKAITIVQVKSMQCTVLAQYCLPTLHSKPRMV